MSSVVQSVSFLEQMMYFIEQSAGTVSQVVLHGALSELRRQSVSFIEQTMYFIATVYKNNQLSCVSRSTE